MTVMDQNKNKTKFYNMSKQEQKPEHSPNNKMTQILPYPD